MNKHPNRLWIVVFLLGLVFDFLFWDRSTGVNFPIFAIMCLLGGFGLLLVEGHRPAAKSLWLLVPFIFNAAFTFVRNEPLTRFLSFTFTLVPIALLAVTCLGGRWIEYGLPDYFKNFALLTVSLFARPIEFINTVHKEREERGEPPGRVLNWAILRGLLIAIPIVACFAALLASADVVFSDRLAEIFKPDKIGEYIIRTLLVIVCAYLLAGGILHAASKSRDENLVGEEKPFFKQFLGFTETAIVLISVSLLFIAFVIIQFQYFFGGEVNIGIEGQSYSSYARSGFNELVTVAFFSLLLVLGLSTITRRESRFQRLTYSGLSILIVVLVMIILVSAYQRLMLAIDWHGYSRLRLYPRIFLVWVAILFITVVALEVLRKERYFAFAAMLASLGFAASLTLVNVDASIIRHNTQRVARGLHLNVPHLASLSTDAIPELARQFQDESLPESTHEAVGALLLCYRQSEIADPDPDEDWRSFNLSQWQAQQALELVLPDLEEYNVNDDVFPVRVRTPGEKVLYCQHDYSR
ncbi:MAG: DUF4173 domain-containing protein [Anaerolineales bacterium]|nr:DUF4173 domain-containing protein [Anaerolineales bacterium]